MAVALDWICIAWLQNLQLLFMHRASGKKEGLGVEKVVIILIEVVGDFAFVGPGDGRGRRESPGRGRVTEST